MMKENLQLLNAIGTQLVNLKDVEPAFRVGNTMYVRWNQKTFLVTVDECQSNGDKNRK